MSPARNRAVALVPAFRKIRLALDHVGERSYRLRVQALLHFLDPGRQQLVGLGIARAAPDEPHALLGKRAHDVILVGEALDQQGPVGREAGAADKDDPGNAVAGVGVLERRERRGAGLDLGESLLGRGGWQQEGGEQQENDVLHYHAHTLAGRRWTGLV